jgi:signal transduction histidine kinase
MGRCPRGKVIAVAERLKFSPLFSQKMVLISGLLALTISLMTPLTYLLMGWHDKDREALIYAEEIARRAQQSIIESPDLWYYGLDRFIDIQNDKTPRNVQSIALFDNGSVLKYEKVINAKATVTHSARIPVRYNNETFGFVEVKIRATDLIAHTSLLALLFMVVGIATGISLYRFTVPIVKLAERKVQEHAAEAKKLADEEIERLGRLRLVGQMAASLGHEIRNPLTTVRGYLQFFSQKNPFIPYTSQFDLMIEELDRANSIITEFLSMAHNKTVDKKYCNLNSIVVTLLPLIESDAMLHGISLKTTLTDIPDAFLDEQEIRQLILNITRNGLEAMESGGCLTVRTSLKADYILLSITDQGPGIDPDILPMLGTPFFTTKERGTGLGLAVCYSIAHRHGAKINCHSNNKGTTFNVRFPNPSNKPGLN